MDDYEPIEEGGSVSYGRQRTDRTNEKVNDRTNGYQSPEPVPRSTNQEAPLNRKKARKRLVWV